MTHAQTDPLTPHAPSLRRGSDREQRTIRLCWLLGWTGAAIAARLGCHASTVRRRMRAFDLCKPEAPGERERLVQAATLDRLADDLLAGGDVMKLAPQIAKHAPQAPSPSTETAELYDNDDLNGDWRDWAARLRAARGAVDTMVPGLETKSARDNRGKGARRARPAHAEDCLQTSLPSGRPRYTGSAAGRLAHMVVHGWAWRREDTGGR